MANKKFTDLNATTSLVGTDLIAVTVDPATTPVSKKSTISTLMAQAPVQSVAGRTGAVTLSNTDVTGLGTASTQDVGTANGNVVQLDATGLPAVDGSQLTNVSGTDSSKLAIANNLSDLNNAATARSNLGVDAAGTDNSTDVTLTAVANNYLSLSGQEITAGVVPVSLGGTGSGDLATARANLGLGTAATTASSDYATATQGTTADSALQPGNSINELGDVGTSGATDGQALIWDSFANQWQPGDAGASAIDDLSDVDTSTVAPTTNDFLNWDGSNWVPAVPTADVDTPLTTALRGTTNQHIGAYPNQSFKVIDNPYQSVMVVADEAGNLKLLNSLGVNNIAVGFSVVEDGDEPDIEAVSGSERYSVISGDSDKLAINGLPYRQGFNNPDIGAYASPTLISGGSIA